MGRGVPRFRLQSVLELRTQQAEQCQLQLTQLLMQRAQLLEHLDQLRQQIRQVHHDSPDWVESGQHWLGYLQRLRQQESGWLSQIRSQEALIQQQQTLLTQARIQEKSLDKLRDRHREQHQQALAHQDAQFMDELAGRAISLI